jgi:hypothetical protein
MHIPALDSGFVVTRDYQGAQRNEKGQWVIAKGTRVSITITMVTTYIYAHY